MFSFKDRSASYFKLLGITASLLVLVMISTLVGVSAGSHSQKYWMKKTLKAYKAGRFTDARRYNKKMRKTAKESCVKKMSAQQKKKYRAIVKKWPTEFADYSSEPYLWDYYLTDYNNDGTADLIILTGTCEADAVYRVYTYKKSKIKKIGKFGGGHSYLSAYPGANGVVRVTQHMGYERICRVYRKNGQSKSKKLNTRQTENYITLRNKLKSHVYYDDDLNQHMKLGDLK